MDQDERRAHPRHPVSVRVHISDLGEVSGSLSRDISQGGVFLETRIPKVRGAVLPLLLIDPISGEEIALMGRVVRAVRRDGKLQGLAVEFTHMSDHLSEKLQEFIARASDAEDGANFHEQAIQGMRPYSVLAIKDFSGDPPPTQRQLLSVINGRRTLNDVLSRSGLPVPEALKELRAMLESGRIELRDDEATSARPGVPVNDPLRQAFVAERVDQYLGLANEAQTAGRYPEAVRYLQLALDLRPENATPIHLKLGQLALYNLDNTALAERHLIAATALDPDNLAVRAALDELTERKSRQQDEPRQEPPDQMTLSGDRKRKRVHPLVVACGVVIVGLAAWNAVRYLGGEKPTEISLNEITDLVPAKSAHVMQGRMYVTVESGWAGLDNKEGRLTQLAERARKYDVDEVIVSDTTPKLLARVHLDTVRVYDP